MSYDGDMFIMEEYGLILIRDIIIHVVKKAKEITSEYYKLGYYTKTGSDTTKEQLMYTAIVNGNDYSQDSDKKLDWKNCNNKSRTYEECRNRFINNQEKLRQFDIAWRKYDLDDYPDFPLNYISDSNRNLPDNIDDEFKGILYEINSLGIENLTNIVKSVEIKYVASRVMSLYFSSMYNCNVFVAAGYQRQCIYCYYSLINSGSYKRYVYDKTYEVNWI